MWLYVFVDLQLPLITYFPPPLIALWDIKRQKCTSDPACELWDEMMLLDTREREREANRAARPAARPAVRAAPVPERAVPVPERAGIGFFRQFFQPPVHEPPPPEPPRPAVQVLGFNDGGDFDWIDNPSTYAQFATAFAILIQS